MLEKIKGLGAQAATSATGAVQGISSSLKSGADAVANAATSVHETINETAVRVSTAQMCRIMEVAITELKSRPLSERPVSLTASVNFGIATLEMQIHLSPSTFDGTTAQGEAPLQA